MPQVFIENIINQLKTHILFLGVLSVYILFVLFVGLNGNFPINDDWYFLRQVESFLLGNIHLNAKILPIFISQGLLGVIWSFFFGVTFTSLRVLTFLVTIVSSVYVYKIGLHISKNIKYSAILTSLFLFNPLVLSTTFTFMTEPYSLCFMFICIFYALHFFRFGHKRSFVMLLAFASLATLCRQTNLVLFPVIFIYLLLEKKTEFLLKHRVITLLVMFLNIGIILLWPRHFTNVIDYSIPLSLNSLDYILFERTVEFLRFIPVLLFWLLPLFASVPLVRHKKTFILTFTVAILFTVVIFKLDVFSVGSVFYFEGLHIKSVYRHDLSIFDNIPAKLIISFILSYIGSNFLIFSLSCIKQIKSKVLDKSNFFFALLSFGYTVPLFFTVNLYDRYMLSSVFIFMFLFVNVSNEKIKITKAFYLFLFIPIIFSMFHVYEYMTVRQLKFQIAEKILKSYHGTVGREEIYIDDTNTKYEYAHMKEDYIGIDENLPIGVVFKCYVLQDTKDSKFTGILSNIEGKLERHIENPKVYDSNSPIMGKRIPRNKQLLSFSEMYFSPAYSIIGKSAYVAGWCEK